jgi:small subunit ribosomal protein S4
MTKNGTPRGRIVRRLGVNIFGNPKYDRLLDRKPAGPGKAPKSRAGKKSEYALQLAEKQKYRDAYGLGERQFRNLYLKASRSEGSTGAALLIALESRLDNTVYRLGWAPSRPAARQLVTHGQLSVNGRRLDKPAAALKPGDELELTAGGALVERLSALAPRGPASPSWLEKREGQARPAARVLAKPNADEAFIKGDIRRVVEYYAR